MHPSTSAPAPRPDHATRSWTRRAVLLAASNWIFAVADACRHPPLRSRHRRFTLEVTAGALGCVACFGHLKTHAGTFGPGSFVWFPNGMRMEHGATDDAAVTTLFITNKPFDIGDAFEDEQDSSTGS